MEPTIFKLRLLNLNHGSNSGLQLIRVLSLVAHKIFPVLIGYSVSANDDTLIRLNFKPFPGYKIKIKLICRLTKRGDKVLINDPHIQNTRVSSSDRINPEILP